MEMQKQKNNCELNELIAADFSTSEKKIWKNFFNIFSIKTNFPPGIADCERLKIAHNLACQAVLLCSEK